MLLVFFHGQKKKINNLNRPRLTKKTKQKKKPSMFFSNVRSRKYWYLYTNVGSKSKKLPEKKNPSKIQMPLKKKKLQYSNSNKVFQLCNFPPLLFANS